MEWLIHLYAYAEIYTVLLFWITVPLAVIAVILLLRRYLPSASEE